MHKTLSQSILSNSMMNTNQTRITVVNIILFASFMSRSVYQFIDLVVKKLPFRVQDIPLEVRSSSIYIS